MALRVVFSLFLLSFLEERVVNDLHRATNQDNIDIAVGILSGHPYWKAFQNRLLGPEIVSVLTRITHLSFYANYQIFCFASAYLANLTCYLLTSRVARSSKDRWFYTIIYAASFVALQDAHWLYLWDYVDLTLMMMFAWIVVTNRVRLGELAVLFFLELLNRESAEFIALWVIINSIEIQSGHSWKFKININWMVTGTIMLAFGILWTHFVRDTMCISETGTLPQGVHEISGGQFFLLPSTIYLIKTTPPFVVGTMLIFIGVLLASFYKSRIHLGQQAWKVGVLICAMIMANVLFSTIVEMRVWFMILPMIVCLVFVAQNEPSRYYDYPSTSK